MMRFRLAFLAMFSFFCLHAQDPFFSQYSSSPMFLNPAFAGSTGQARATGTFRNEWPKFRGNFVTTNIAYDQYFPKLHGGLGFDFQYDKGMQVPVTTNAGSLSYAFHLPLFKNRFVLQPGASMAMSNSVVRYNENALNNGDIRDPRRGILYPTSPGVKHTRTNIDFGLGFIAYTQRFTFGFSVTHLTPNLEFFGDRSIQERTVLHASYVIGHMPGDFENKLSVVPQVMVMQQGGDGRVQVGAAALFKNYTLGFAGRVDGVVIMMAGFQNRLFRASYSFDLARDNDLTGGSHEVSLQFFLFAKRKPENFLAPATILF